MQMHHNSLSSDQYSFLYFVTFIWILLSTGLEKPVSSIPLIAKHANLSCPRDDIFLDILAIIISGAFSDVAPSLYFTFAYSRPER